MGFLRQEPDGLGEVVDAVVVEIAGDMERCFVGHRALAAVAEKPFAGEKAIGPGGEDIVGDGGFAEDPEAGIAGLRAGERASRPVDGRARAHPMGERIGIGEIRRALVVDRGDRMPDELGVEVQAHRIAGFRHGEQHGGGGEGGGQAGGFRGGESVEDIEVSPTAVDVFIAAREIDLLLGEADPDSLFLGIDFPLIEARDGAESVGVAPGVVGGGLFGAAEFRQFRGGPCGGFVDAGGDILPGIRGVDQAGQGESGSTGAEGMVGAWQRCVDVEALGPGGAAP